MELPVYLGLEGHTSIGNLIPGARLQGFSEIGTYRFEVPDDDAQLYADDAALERDITGNYWVWQPGFFAGEVELELVIPGLTQPIHYIADVGPAKHKTGRAQYAEYLSQIVDYAPTLVAGTEPAKHGLGGRSGDALSLWIRYARLRQFIDRYLTGAKAITQRPIIRLANHREQIPLSIAKRVDTTTLQRLISSPELLASLANTADGIQNPGYGDNLLDAPFHEPTMDNPANRLMVSQLGEVRRLVRGLLRDIANYKEKNSETVTELASRLPRRAAYLHALDKQLIRLQRCEPYASANPSKQGAAALNAVSGNPHYNMTHRAGVRLLRLGLSDLADDEQHYLAPTWEIYEAWCFVSIARALEYHLPDCEWSLDSNPTFADLILRGKSEGQTVTLYYQMVCKSLEQENSYGYCSISGERRPDLVLEVADSQQSRFICLDSKYTSSRQRILDAMGSAHIYRDSLRCLGTRADLSLIVVPAISESQSVDILATEEYRQRNDVGCYQLSNAADSDSLVSLLLARLPTFSES